MMISRMKAITDKINSGKLNHPNLIVENRSSDLFNNEKEALKNELVEKHVGKTAGVTKRHINFLVELFGTTYADKIDPKAMSNILKNPSRLFTKLRKLMGSDAFRDYVTKTDKVVPESTNATVEILKAENDSLKTQLINITKKMDQVASTEQNEHRKKILTEFSDFIKNRNQYRKKMNDEDLTNMEVSFYPGNFTELKTGRVLIDYNHIDAQKFLKSIGASEDIEKDMVKFDEIKSKFTDKVLVKSGSDELVLPKRNILPKKYKEVVESSDSLNAALEDEMTSDKEQSIFSGATSIEDIIKFFNTTGIANFYLDRAKESLAKYGFKPTSFGAQINSIRIRHDRIEINTREEGNSRLTKLFKILDDFNDKSKIRFDNELLTISGIKKIGERTYESGNLIININETDAAIESVEFSSNDINTLRSLMDKLRSNGFEIDIAKSFSATEDKKIKIMMSDG